MTTDFLVDIAHDGRTRQIACAVKPSEALTKPRVADKLDIERLYWASEAAEWGIVTEKELPTILTRSIGWVHKYKVVDDFSQPYPGYLKEKAQLVLNELAHRSGITIERFSKQTDQLLSMEPGTALMLVRHEPTLGRHRVDRPPSSAFGDGTVEGGSTSSMSHRMRRCRYSGHPKISMGCLKKEMRSSLSRIHGWPRSSIRMFLNVIAGCATNPGI